MVKIDYLGNLNPMKISRYMVMFQPCKLHKLQGVLALATVKQSVEDHHFCPQ